MSNYHAYLDDCAPVAPASTITLEATIEALRASARQVAASLVRWVQERGRRDITRYSDHLLRDMGFERDWDGSILLRRGQDSSR